MKKTILLLLLSLLTIQSLEANNISSLLSNINNKNEMYHKTEVESAGTLILFSRKKMNRMQIHTLKDILVSLRFFNYREDTAGEPSMSPSGFSSITSSMFRLYIDNHELSSSIYGSSMLQFSNLNLGFADHIEIYEGGNAISFGNEPGLITIRIYSKDPNKEKISSISGFIDNRNSTTEEICHTDFSKKKSSLMYISLANINRKKEYYNTYSKDYNSKIFYMKYNLSKRDILNIGYFNQDKDTFMGVGNKHNIVNPNNDNRKHLFMEYQHKYKNNLNLSLSLDNIKNNLLFSDKSGIQVLNVPSFNKFNGKFTENIFKINMKKIFTLNKNKLLIGLQDIYKKYKINYMNMDKYSYNLPNEGPSSLNIFSVYMEDKYYINLYNLFIVSMKYDIYRNNYNNKNYSEESERLGYIHLFTNNISSKTFISKTYLYPGFGYTSTFPKWIYPNPNLSSEKYYNYIEELNYKNKRINSKIGVTFTTSKDNIYINSNNKFFNNKNFIKTLRYYLNTNYTINYLNNVEFEIYNTKFLTNKLNATSSMYGGYIRLINSIGKFDIFNEMIFKSSYTYAKTEFTQHNIKVNFGYNYNMGIKWKIKRNLILSLKGENIFNKASKSPVYGINTTNGIDQKLIIGMRYFF